MNNIDTIAIWENCKRKMHDFNLKYKNERCFNSSVINVIGFGIFYNVEKIEGFLLAYEHLIIKKQHKNDRNNSGN